MFTRCPGCSTVHPVNAAILAQNGGHYRCGKCSKTSNALESLFDEWPEPGNKPAKPGDLPVLGTEIDLEKAQQARLDPNAADDDEVSGAAPKPSRAARFFVRTAWLLGGLIVGAVIIVNVAEFAGQPVIEQEEIDAAKVALGLEEPPRREIFRDLELIHLVSRRLAANPERPGFLTLEATIVNRASRSQPYPSIEVILFDAGGARLSSHEFPPSNYLSGSSAPGATMAPHAYLPLSLQLEDPGVQAVGFELNFH